MAQTINGIDANGIAYAVTIEPHGEAFAACIAHPAFNGGAPIAVTGLSEAEGGKATQRALADWMERPNAPDMLIDLDGVAYGRRS